MIRHVPSFAPHACAVLVFAVAGCGGSANHGEPPAGLSAPGAAAASGQDEPLEPLLTSSETAVENARPAAAREVANSSEGDSASIPYFNPLTSRQAEEGWISLFDGHTLFGWVPNDGSVNWHVENESIVADAGPVGLLLTTVPWADFEFRCEYRMEKGGNSGIFVRTIPQPQQVTADCYEVNIADEHPQGYTTGCIVGRAKTSQPIQGSGDWKTLGVKAEGKHLVISVDGQQVLDFTDESDTPRLVGQLGLQKNAGKIEFRNLILRPLGLKDLFNGSDLAGWREVPGSKSQFTVDGGAIRCRNGQGFLETEQTFADFVFQAQAKTHAPELNSGFFFRAMPGTEQEPSNGYEVQIHNGFEGEDRTKPSNAGTGAIFRRVEARRVVPSDLEWFTTTLVAEGNHIAVWVDGYQVVDWTDTRAPNENPRRGRRDQAGHISLQGHDPTTDLSFRHLKAAELP